MERRERGLKHHGPKYPKTPVGIVKRAVRGMLPYKKARGRNALKRLTVHSYIPENAENMEQWGRKNLTTSFMRLKNISKEIGGQNE